MPISPHGTENTALCMMRCRRIVIETRLPEATRTNRNPNESATLIISGPVSKIGEHTGHSMRPSLS